MKSYPRLSKASLARYRKLHQRKFRESMGLYIAEGLRTVEQLAGKATVECVILHDGLSDAHPAFALAKRCREVYVADEQEFNALCDTEQAQGIIAVVRIPDAIQLTDLARRERGLLLALDAVQDPGNSGTLYRTAAWFGACGFMMGSGTVDLFNAKVVRSTAGALGSLPWLLSANLPESLRFLHESGWEIYLLDGAGTGEDIRHVLPADKSIVVVGNEANGISDALLAWPGFRRVRIPGQPGQVESLNAAVSGAIALYHFSGR